jgi:hypothetical protein
MSGRSPRSTIRGRRIPVRLKGEVAERKTTIAFDLKRDDKGIALEGVDLVHGASDIKGKIDIRDAPKPVVDGAPHSTSIDLSELTGRARRPAGKRRRKQPPRAPEGRAASSATRRSRSTR